MPKQFVQAVAIIAAFTVATRALGFIFRMFLARILGPEMLGVYQIALAFFMVFLTIIATGLPLAISKEVAKAKERGQDKDIGTIAATGLITSLVVSIVLCGIVFLLREFIGNIFTDERCMKILLILLPAVVLSSVYTSLRAVWWGEKKFILLGATELLEQIARVVLFAVLIAIAFIGLDAAGLAALSFTIACLVSAVVVVVLFYRRNSGIKHVTPQHGGYYRPIIKSATPITGVRFLGSIAIPLISIIIPLRLIAAGSTQIQAISEYGIIIGMTLPLLMIPGTVIGAMATALVPELSGAHQRKDKVQVTKQINGALTFTLFVTFLLLPAFMALGQHIGIFIFDNAASGRYLSLTAWVMIPLSLNMITNAILNSLGAETKAMKHYMYGSVFLFLIVWFGPAYVGVNALAIGLGVCMLIASTMNVVMINRLTGAKTRVMPMVLRFSAVSLPAFLLGFFIFGIAQHVWPFVIALGLAGSASVSVVLFLSRQFNLVDTSILKRKK